MTASTTTDIATLSGDVTKAVYAAVRRGYPNSGQVCILNAVALLQVMHAANGDANGYAGATRAQVIALTNLSESTVRSHIKWWSERSVLDGVETGVGVAYTVRVAS